MICQKKLSKQPVAHEKINFLKFFFINVLDNNIKMIFYLFFYSNIFCQNLSFFAIKKKNKKTQFLTPCFDVKNLIKKIIFLCILVVIGSIYLKNGLFMSNEAGDKKSEPTEVPFQRFQDSGKRYW